MGSLMQSHAFSVVGCSPSPAGESVRLCKSGWDEGFTLVEVMVALFIFIVSLLGLVAVTTSVIHGNAFSREMTTATSLAQDQLEVLKRSGYNDSALTAGDHTDTPLTSYTRTWTVTDNTPATGIKTVTMTVTWNWRGASHNVQLVTLITSK